MFEFFQNFFQSDFMPHGHCYMWRSDILWLHVLSDAAIVLAYYSIPIALFYFVRRRKDLKFRGLFLLFAAFILLCGTTHLMEIWSVWNGTYRLTGSLKAATGVVSVVTAALLWPIIPQALKIPSPDMLSQANEDLRREIEERKRIEAQLKAHQEMLEERVAERTAALETVNAQLKREIWHREQQARQLARYTRDLERSNQDLDEFAYVASHDLRAPLRAIHNLAGWIREDTEDVLPESAAEDLTLLQQRVSRMQHLLDALLQYSRLSRRDDQTVAVNTHKLATDVVGLLHAPPDFTITVAPDLPTVEAPKVILEQIFLNLISNAIKHHHRTAGHIRVYAQPNEATVTFTIEDDGPGIPAAFQDRIFQMFSTLKPRDEVESSGMGLALVKKLVERYGGSISVESVEGEGSRFIFTWPYDTPA